MDTKRLINLVKDKIISGYSDEEIHNFLVREGLSDEKIEEILHLCLQELHLEENDVIEENSQIEADDTDDKQVVAYHNYHVPNHIPLPGAWWLLVQSCIILKENLLQILALALMWLATSLIVTIIAVLLSIFLVSISQRLLPVAFIFDLFILLSAPSCYFISVIRLISVQSNGVIASYLYSIKRFFRINLTSVLVSFAYLMAVILFIVIFTTILFSSYKLAAILVGIVIAVPLCAILVWYALTSVVMANDEKYYIKAIARSREYIRGHFFGFWGRSVFISSIVILILILFAVITPAENKEEKSFGETLSKKVFAIKEKEELKNKFSDIAGFDANFSYKRIPFESFVEADFVIDGNWTCNRYDQYNCTTYKKTKSGEITNQSKQFIDDYENIKNTLAKNAKNYWESYSQIKADNFICDRQNLYYCNKDGFPQIYGYPDDLSKEIVKLNSATKVNADDNTLINGDLPAENTKQSEEKDGHSKKLINLDLIWDIIYFVIILPIFAIYFQILYVYLSRNKKFSDDFTFSKKHKILFLILVSIPIVITIATVAFFGKFMAIVAGFK